MSSLCAHSFAHISNSSSLVSRPRDRLTDSDAVVAFFQTSAVFLTMGTDPTRGRLSGQELLTFASTITLIRHLNLGSNADTSLSAATQSAALVMYREGKRLTQTADDHTLAHVFALVVGVIYPLTPAGTESIGAEPDPERNHCKTAVDRASLTSELLKRAPLQHPRWPAQECVDYVSLAKIGSTYWIQSLLRSARGLSNGGDPVELEADAVSPSTIIREYCSRFRTLNSKRRRPPSLDYGRLAFILSFILGASSFLQSPLPATTIEAQFRIGALLDHWADSALTSTEAIEANIDSAIQLVRYDIAHSLLAITHPSVFVSLIEFKLGCNYALWIPAPAGGSCENGKGLLGSGSPGWYQNASCLRSGVTCRGHAVL